jgi:hypothetical protein
MSALERNRQQSAVQESESDFAALSNRPVMSTEPTTGIRQGAATAFFDGFDLQDQPLISGLPELPGEVVTARTTVALVRAQAGSAVVVLFEQGDVRRPIIVGVLQHGERTAGSTDSPLVSVQVDDARLVLSAEREIVLQCGEASITLTRAGKVVIKGKYVVSRSSGYNKIKGAAVEIN